MGQRAVMLRKVRRVRLIDGIIREEEVRTSGYGLASVPFLFLAFLLVLG